MEDSASDAELTLRALKESSVFIHVHWVKDGAEALDFMFCDGAYSRRASNQMLKLVLLDLDIPKVDGIEVLRRLRADARTWATPVVIMTSSDAEHDAADSHKLGVNCYITKPVQFKAFLGTVSKLGLYWVLGT